MRMTAAQRKAFQRLGRKGGKTRAENMTAEQRSAHARNAARARWAKKEKTA